MSEWEDEEEGPAQEERAAAGEDALEEGRGGPDRPERRGSAADAQRLANLETVVRALARDVAELRAMVRAELPGAELRAELRTATAAPPPAAPAEPTVPVSAGALSSIPAAPRREERRVRSLTDVVRDAMRDTLDPPGTPRPVAPSLGGAGPSTARSRAGRPANREGYDVESLVGRYGTMALAALTIVMGVGVFLRWAVEHVEVGPTTRVAFGALVAGLIAAMGWWLRTRPAGGSRRYGNTLLGLALAIVHVDAWGAGPYLHVVPSGVALAVAALASTALAALAFASGEQALFAVGLGGALLAPFVTSAGDGTVPALLGYGLVVVLGACAALGSTAARGHHWGLARRLAGAGGAGYAVASLPLPAPSGSWPLQAAPPLFALIVAWAALGLAGRVHRAPLARTLLVGCLVALVARGVDRAAGGGPMTDVVIALVITALLATATAFATARLTEEDEARSVFWGAVLPIAFLLSALLALPDTRGVQGATVGTLWALLAFGAARVAGPLRRQPPLVTAGAAAAAAVLLGCNRYPVAGVTGLAAVGVLFALLAARLARGGERARLVLVPAAFSLTAASLWAQALLELRPAYRYTPFLTRASLAALASVLGWGAFGLVVAHAPWREEAAREGGVATPLPPSGRALVASLGVVAAFLWVRAELVEAYSRDVATFLLIGYYAVAGVATIFVGRQRTVAGARRVGLALAVYAALKALAEASGLDPIGLRVGSFLLVGLFLLAVAYWYRAAGDAVPAAGETG